MLNPSRIYLPKLDEPPATVLEFLEMKFPMVPREVWVDRMERGIVTAGSGRKLRPTSPYAHGLTVLYHREVAQEPVVPFEERVVYRDERIIVVDKPHFLPVTPGGTFVEQTLLARLIASTGLRTLTPMHRIDRDTAGLVLFVIEAEHRAAYHELFRTETIAKEYLAVAHVESQPDVREWTVENRLEPSDPWYRMEIAEGEPNSSTNAVLEEWRNGRGLFRLEPRTGKKHQLRVHMASIGYPIVNDSLYPEILTLDPGDFSRPLQLVARTLEFTDPITGEALSFASSYSLSLEDHQ